VAFWSGPRIGFKESRAVPPAAIALPETIPLPRIGPCFPISLGRTATHRLDQSMIDADGNDLGELLAGRNPESGQLTLGGIPFWLDGVTMVGPGGVNDAARPVPPAHQVEGIAIGQKARHLHFLHGVHYQAPRGTRVGAYVAHYANGSAVEIPIYYGLDVADWWTLPDTTASRARRVWTGENESSRRRGRGIQLFLKTWTNPYPEQKIESLDIVAADPPPGEHPNAPFLVGLTAEGAREHR
jgi:hypothetical protein